MAEIHPLGEGVYSHPKVYKKAFDIVRPEALRDKLREYDINDSIIEATEIYTSRLKAQTVLDSGFELLLGFDKDAYYSQLSLIVVYFLWES